MGEIVPVKGKRANYQFELDRNHFASQYKLGNKLAALGVHGIYVEGELFHGANAIDKPRVDTDSNLSQKQLQLVKDVQAQSQILGRPIDVWYSDPGSRNDATDLTLFAPPLLTLAASAALLKGVMTPKEKITRRRTLKWLGATLMAPVVIQIGSAIEAIQSPRTDKSGAPKAGPFTSMQRNINPWVNRFREEHAGAMVHAIVDQYQKEKIARPTVALAWGAGHAEIGQLIENDDNHRAVLTKLAKSSNGSDRLLHRFTYTPYKPHAGEWTYTQYQLVAPQTK